MAAPSTTTSSSSSSSPAPSSPFTLTPALERTVFTLNRLLGSTSPFKEGALFPLRTGEQLFLGCSDGVLPLYLAMLLRPGCVAPSKVHHDAGITSPSSPFHAKVMTAGERGSDPLPAAMLKVGQNLDLLHAALADLPAPCSSLRISPKDITSLNAPHVFEVVRVLADETLLSRVAVLHHPSLLCLLPVEGLPAGSAEQPRELLLAWANHHLSSSPSSPTRISNLSSDLADCGALLQLLRATVPPSLVNHAELSTALSIAPTRPERLKVVLAQAARLDLAVPPLSAHHITSGDEGVLAPFLAALFDRFPAVLFPRPHELAGLEDEVRHLMIRRRELDEAVLPELARYDAAALDALALRTDAMRVAAEELAGHVAQGEAEGAHLRAEIERLEQQEPLLEEELERVRAEGAAEAEALEAHPERIVEAKIRQVNAAWGERLRQSEDLYVELEHSVLSLRKQQAEEAKRRVPTEVELAALRAALAELEQGVQERNQARAKELAQNRARLSSTHEQLAALELEVRDLEKQLHAVRSSPQAAPAPTAAAAAAAAAAEEKKKKKKLSFGRHLASLARDSSEEALKEALKFVHPRGGKKGKGLSSSELAEIARALQTVKGELGQHMSPKASADSTLDDALRAKMAELSQAKAAPKRKNFVF